MSTLQKSIVAVFGVAALLGGIAFFGYSPFIKTLVSIGASPSGSTGRSALQYSIYGINLAAPGANATSSSIYNSSGQTLFITGIKVGCTGVGTSRTAYTGAGLASLTLSVSTTTTSAPAAVGTNLVGGSAFTIGTSTAYFVLASSTALTTSSNGVYDIWPSATYLTFQTNATNTAVCTFGADVTSS